MQKVVEGRAYGCHVARQFGIANVVAFEDLPTREEGGPRVLNETTAHMHRIIIGNVRGVGGGMIKSLHKCRAQRKSRIPNDVGLHLASANRHRRSV